MAKSVLVPGGLRGARAWICFNASSRSSLIEDHVLLVLSRIRNATTTGKTLHPIENFDVEKYLRGCMSSFAGDQEYEVRIALDAHAAFYAREKPWHASQQLTSLPDGRTELTLRLNHLADVKNAVLTWGSHAEVLSPPELRAEVREAHRAALAQYREC